MSRENNKIREELDDVIAELTKSGLRHNDDYDKVGVGDLVEKALNTVGITEERFKQFFNLKECSCTERKKFLNGLFYWRKKRKEGV